MLSFVLLPIHIQVVDTFRLKPMYQHLIVQFVKPKLLIPIHWIPGDVRFGDPAELEILRRNMPATTELRELTFSG